MKKMKNSLHLGMGHFWIGQRDGVSVAMMRNVESLLETHPEIKITIFGKLADYMEGAVKPIPGKVEYLNINELDPSFEIPGLSRKTISEQKIQDYIWHGTNILEILIDKLQPMDIIIIENLGIGIHPAVTYAFFLYLQYCQHYYPQKRIMYRTHDFLQQRANNFENLKKFQSTALPLTPNWHEVIYPNYHNVGYITINTYDISRLIEHGIDLERISYVPNCVDKDLILNDDEHNNLRRRIIQNLDLPPESRFIFYPVRAIKRKNIEESVFLTCLFNILAGQKINVLGNTIEGHFHLLITIKPDNDEDKEYAELIETFCREYKLPVTIGLQDFISYEREIDPESSCVNKFGLGDAYNKADIVNTTSYLEGFGFAFIEPWFLGKAVIGRNISNITQDFQRAGMNLDHLYNVLRINGNDYRSIGYQDRENIGLERRLQEILNLGDLSYVEGVVKANEHHLSAMMSFLIPGKKDAVINANKTAVAATYSEKKVAERLWHVLTHIRFGSTF